MPYSHLVPMLSAADWCLQSDVMTDSRHRPPLPADLTGLTVLLLKKELTTRGLPITGLKAVR